MISYQEIIDAIERDDMVEAHRLVRERKVRKTQILAELERLSSTAMRAGGHSKELIDRALKLMSEGRAADAAAILEEQMTPEQIHFCNLILELMGLESGCKEAPQSVDMSIAQEMMGKAYEV